MEAVLAQRLNDTPMIICLRAHFVVFFVAVWLLAGFLASTEMLAAEIVTRSYFRVALLIRQKTRTSKGAAIVF